MRRADLAERIDTVEHRMNSMEQRLDASFNALMAEILQSRRENDVAHSAMRTEFARDMSSFRSEVAGEFSTMRAEVAGEFSTMRDRFESVEAAIDDSRAHLEAAIVDLLGVIREGDEALGSALRGAISKGDEEGHRFMLVLHEEVLSRLKLISEGRPSSS